MDELMGSEKEKCCISRISVVREIKRWRVEWAGYVARANENWMQGFGGEA